MKNEYDNKYKKEINTLNETIINLNNEIEYNNYQY
jgi:hypothetical protein